MATLNDSISSIESTLNNETGKVGKDLTIFAHDVKETTGIQCVSIFMEFSRSSFHEIVTNIKTKLLLILLELEKEFGNLDRLDIGLERKKEEDIRVINKKITDIVFADDREVSI